MAGGASQAGDADFSLAPGLTSGLQGSVNVHRGALLLVPQWQCISSSVFYVFLTLFLIYRTGDTQYLKSQWRDLGLNPNLLLRKQIA